MTTDPLALLALSIPLSNRLIERLIKVSERLRETNQVRIRLLGEVFGALRAVKLGKLERYFSKRVATTRQAQSPALHDRARILALYQTINGSVPFLAASLAIAILALTLHTNRMSKGKRTRIFLLGKISREVMHDLQKCKGGRIFHDERKAL